MQSQRQKPVHASLQNKRTAWNLIGRQCDILGLDAATGPQLLEHVLHGFPSAAVVRVADLGIGATELYPALGSPAVIRRRLRARSLLSTAQSDRLAGVAAVVALAEFVFGGLELSLDWLLRSSFSSTLPDPPIRLLSTGYGTDLVRERLWQIRVDAGH